VVGTNQKGSWAEKWTEALGQGDHAPHVGSVAKWILLKSGGYSAVLTSCGRKYVCKGIYLQRYKGPLATVTLHGNAKPKGA
jgi:hypothetical protein